MLASLALLCLFAGVVTGVAPLKWPDQYTVSGNVILPYADVNEPFTAVVDMNGGMSSLSTYGGEQDTIKNYAKWG